MIVEFKIDKNTNTVQVVTEFEADHLLVWNAFTNAVILDQWWAPKPWISKTTWMDFNVGGTRIYAMIGPNGEEHWALAQYTSITPKTNFKYLDAFCDNKGVINDDLPRSYCDFEFVNNGKTTTVNMVVSHENTSDLESLIAMGFKEGFTIALDGLEELLKTLK